MVRRGEEREESKLISHTVPRVGHQMNELLIETQELSDNFIHTIEDFLNEFEIPSDVTKAYLENLFQADNMKNLKNLQNLGSTQVLKKLGTGNDAFKILTRLVHEKNLIDLPFCLALTGSHFPGEKSTFQSPVFETENDVTDSVNCLDIIFISQIGCGSSSHVFLGLHVPTLKIIAIKMIEIVSAVRRKVALSELKVLHKIARANLTEPETEDAKKTNSTIISPFLTKFFLSFINLENCGVCFVIEFMNCGSLQDMLDNGVLFSRDEISIISFSILNALKALHIHGVIHRDVKPSNILTDSKGRIKLTDFGSMKELIKQTEATSFVGTILYMSPTRASGGIYSYESDLWNLGIVVIVLATGRLPYPPGYGYWQLLDFLINAPEPSLSLLEFPADLCSFVNDCLHQPSGDANCASNLLAHDIFKNPCASGVLLEGEIPTLSHPGRNLTYEPEVVDKLVQSLVSWRLESLIIEHSEDIQKFQHQYTKEDIEEGEEGDKGDEHMFDVDCILKTSQFILENYSIDLVAISEENMVLLAQEFQMDPIHLRERFHDHINHIRTLAQKRESFDQFSLGLNFRRSFDFRKSFDEGDSTRLRRRTFDSEMDQIKDIGRRRITFDFDQNQHPWISPHAEGTQRPHSITTREHQSQDLFSRRKCLDSSSFDRVGFPHFRISLDSLPKDSLLSEEALYEAAPEPLSSDKETEEIKNSR